MSLAEQVRSAVGSVVDPELRRTLAELDMLRDITVTEDAAHVGIALTIVGCPAATRIEREVREAAARVPGIASVDVAVGVMTPEERRALTERLRDGRPARTMPFGPDSLTRVIAVTSGKGGVGKSTVTANLAVALAQRGLRVGLVDADIHGFSIPGLLGVPAGTTPTRIDEMILPPVAHDVKVISIGMFLREGAVAWRGPMLHRTVQQFLTDVHFGDLDVLLLDMPPGTGDIAISVGQLLPRAEVLVITTPQAAAAEVAVRSGTVARQTGQRVIGVVETMSPLILPDGQDFAMFGSGGGQSVADALSLPDQPVQLLASVPLSMALRQGGDAGEPVVISDPTDPAAAAIIGLAERVATFGRDLTHRTLPFRTA
ncbi:Mrp/NBP35 family ATP-binding protein [Microbacterium sp. ZW T5_56]|uniref:Mrp/NBP35 family ATP-binding protein n=1 Tax=Microbacterium sp. ZW T5_56 TaxID=3378081 RepID=UPI003852C1F0